jgi:tRNA (guanine-N7-)-methyltransferase
VKENPARTRQHFETLRLRREGLARDLGAILAPGGRFVCEIGCGHGHFLTAYATEHPAQICVGMDIDGDRIERACRKQSRAGLANLHFIRAEAQTFLEVLPVGATIEAVYILFPDPWPKKRHHKHRILQGPFLDALAARAGQGSRLYFRTDYEPYWAEAQALFASRPDWSLVEELWPMEPATVFQSRAPAFRSLVAART